MLRVLLSWSRSYLSYLTWCFRTWPSKSAGRASVDDIDIYYNSYGEGEPLLMLHGGFAYAETWLGQVPALAGGHHVITPDSRGHGRTGLGERHLTYRRMAEDFAAFIGRLDLGPVHLVGWSDGGCASIAMALQRPELVRSITLIGTPYNTENYTLEAKLLLQDFLHPRSLATRLYRLFFKLSHRFLSSEPASWGRFLDAMTWLWTELPDFTLEDLGRITTPVMVVACDRDEFLSPTEDPLQVFKETAAAIPNARMSIIRGGTHMAPLVQARALNEALLGFLRELKEPSSRGG